MPIGKQKRKQYLRRVLLTLLVLLTAMAQNVPWLPAIFGLRALPLLPLTVAIAILEQEIPAVLFAALGGLSWDLAADSHGLHALFLTATGFLCAMLLRYLLNRNWQTVALLSAAVSAGYLFLRWALEFAFPGRDLAMAVLLRSVLPSAAYTMLFCPFFYLLVRHIVRRTSRRQRGVLAQ
ncbi:MAG: rod shape-determining protein MreD [Oscillospiraceae bacterium]|jgi:rod shape-determining protein MreD|nr:rod shape-determining protein MreD [Oscillospiraceae bacterium]